MVMAAHEDSVVVFAVPRSTSGYTMRLYYKKSHKSFHEPWQECYRHTSLPKYIEYSGPKKVKLMAHDYDIALRSSYADTCRDMIANSEVIMLQPRELISSYLSWIIVYYISRLYVKPDVWKDGGYWSVWTEPMRDRLRDSYKILDHWISDEFVKKSIDEYSHFIKCYIKHFHDVVNTAKTVRYVTQETLHNNEHYTDHSKVFQTIEERLQLFKNPDWVITYIEYNIMLHDFEGQLERLFDGK